VDIKEINSIVLKENELLLITLPEETSEEGLFQIGEWVVRLNNGMLRDKVIIRREDVKVEKIVVDK